jgi:hypothetical protein
VDVNLCVKCACSWLHPCSLGTGTSSLHDRCFVRMGGKLLCRNFQIERLRTSDVAEKAARAQSGLKGWHEWRCARIIDTYLQFFRRHWTRFLDTVHLRY